METLTKESFWNELYEKYPGEMNTFCRWIDKYKTENNWYELFNEGAFLIKEEVTDKLTIAPKFHEIPFAMQIGIFLQFVAEKNSGSIEYIIEDIHGFKEIPELIKEWFFYEQDKAIQDHQNGKYE